MPVFKISSAKNTWYIYIEIYVIFCMVHAYTKAGKLGRAGKPKLGSLKGHMDKHTHTQKHK